MRSSDVDWHPGNFTLGARWAELPAQDTGAVPGRACWVVDHPYGVFVIPLLGPDRPEPDERKYIRFGDVDEAVRAVTCCPDDPCQPCLAGEHDPWSRDRCSCCGRSIPLETPPPPAM
jgi:hypothetical protein